ncbi:MAG: hypothetical protein PHQ35_02775 [Phycisphaerae bacterium]|nr:hypothetical protein [Phycisphaerae bacterium]MDD5380783.1 hypothetical protein [Phycisphaerae bacterium]
MVNRVFSDSQQFNPISIKLRLCGTLIFNLFFPLVLLSLSSVLKGENPKSALSVQELKELAPLIKVAERKPQNIKIDAESWVETKADFYDPCEPWLRTPIYKSYTTWVDGGPKGKVRVDMHREVTKWINGSAPYGEEIYSMSFDGQHGRYVQAKKGEILPDKPKRIGYDAGTHWSLPFFDGEIYKFSKCFELASDPNSEAATELEFTFEEFEGAECIKIRSRLYDVTYWLDPSHGFALRGYKSIAKYPDNHEELIKLVKVTKLKEVSHGVWWPVEVVTVSKPYQDGEPWRRFVYRASNVVANNPNFDESIFTVPFPKGYRVEDKITGKNYVVDANLALIPEPNNPPK